MALEVVSAEAIREQDWDDLVQQSPDGFVFALSSWLSVIRQVEDWHLTDMSVGVTESGRLLGVMPLHYEPGQQLLSSTAWGPSGPVLAQGITEKKRAKVAHALLEYGVELGRQLGALQFKFQLPGVCETGLMQLHGINPYELMGYEDHSTLCRIIDLTRSESELNQGLSKTSKHSIRDARALGYTVEEASWLDCLDSYYEIHQLNYKRTGVKPHPRLYFQGIAETMSVIGHAKLFVAKDQDGKPVAFHNAAVLGERGYYQTGCSLEQCLKDGVNYLLFWEALMTLRASGLQFYDCGKVDPSSKDSKMLGLTRFKSKFGGAYYRQFACAVTLKDAQNSESQSLSKGAEHPPGKRVLLKEFLRSGKRLSESCLGTGPTELISRTLHWTNRMSGISTSTEEVPAPKEITLPFIKPLWLEEECSAEQLINEGYGQKANSEARSKLEALLEVGADESVFLLSSGRSAMELGLRIMHQHYPHHSEVLIPSYGCRGVYDPVVKAGLTPVFVDINPDLTPDQDEMISKMNERTLACILVHLCGAVMPFDRLQPIALERDVFLLEDCCHYLGGTGVCPESHMRVYSFGNGKTVTATAGGALWSRISTAELSKMYEALPEDDASAAMSRFRYMRDRYISEPDKSDSQWESTWATQYGQAKMSQLDCLLLKYQLDRLNDIIRDRRRHGKYLREIISESELPVLLQNDALHTFTKLTLIFKHADDFNELFRCFGQEGIGLEHMYQPLHQRNLDSNSRGVKLPYTEQVGGKVVNIPIRPNLTPSELELIARSIHSMSKSS